MVLKMLFDILCCHKMFRIYFFLINKKKVSHVLTSKGISNKHFLKVHKFSGVKEGNEWEFCKNNERTGLFSAILFYFDHLNNANKIFIGNLYINCRNPNWLCINCRMVEPLILKRAIFWCWFTSLPWFCLQELYNLHQNRLKFYPSNCRLKLWWTNFREFW